MTTNIFTYGSLMFPQVWERVVRKRYRAASASAAGYGRFAIVGESYPGLVARPGASVAGVVYFDLDEHDVAALDAFEGQQYRCQPIALELTGGGGITADTYLFIEPQRLSELPWLPEEFQVHRFLESYCREKLDN